MQHDNLALAGVRLLLIILITVIHPGETSAEHSAARPTRTSESMEAGFRLPTSTRSPAKAFC
jgi:hypothetical protein